MTNREMLLVLEERLTRLAEYYEAQARTTRQMITDHSNQVQLSLLAADKAINKADADTDRRFEGVNEFRRTLSDQAATFVTRDLHDSLQEIHNKDIRDVRDLIDNIRSAQSRTIGMAVGVSTTITFIGVLGSIILRLATGG